MRLSSPRQRQRRGVMRDVLGVKVERQTELFETLPRTCSALEMLKANNLLRYVNEQLDSPVNRFRSIAAAAEEGIAATSSRRRRGSWNAKRATETGETVGNLCLDLQQVELRRGGGRDAPCHFNWR